MKQILLPTLFVLILSVSANAAPASDYWRFALGYSYLSQVDEIKDSYKHLARDAGEGKDVYNTSLSLRFQPYYQFSSGIRTGICIGPLIMMHGDVHHFQVPLNISLGYSFFKDSPFSAYILCGAAYHIATGDFYSDSTPGFYGGMGCEILNTEPVHLGFEVAYDSSAITLDRGPAKTSRQSITTGELTVFLYADF